MGVPSVSVRDVFGGRIVAYRREIFRWHDQIVVEEDGGDVVMWNLDPSFEGCD